MDISQYQRGSGKGPRLKFGSPRSRRTVGDRTGVVAHSAVSAMEQTEKATAYCKVC